MRSLTELEKDYIRWQYAYAADIIIVYVEKYGDPNNDLKADIEKAKEMLYWSSKNEQN